MPVFQGQLQQGNVHPRGELLAAASRPRWGGLRALWGKPAVRHRVLPVPLQLPYECDLPDVCKGDGWSPQHPCRSLLLSWLERFCADLMILLPQLKQMLLLPSLLLLHPQGVPGGSAQGTRCLDLPSWTVVTSSLAVLFRAEPLLCFYSLLFGGLAEKRLAVSRLALGVSSLRSWAKEGGPQMLPLGFPSRGC